MSILRAQWSRSFFIIPGLILCLALWSPLSHAAAGDLILDSSIILRENRENTTLLKQGYSLSLDKIQYSMGYSEKDEVFLTLYKHGKVVQKMTVNDRDSFYYNTAINSTEYTIIQAEVTVFYGVGGPNFIKLDPFRQYSDGTAYEPFNADTVFHVPGITAPVEEWNRTFGGPYYDESSRFLLHTLDGGYTIAGLRSSHQDHEYISTIWLIHTDTKGSEQWNRTLEDIGEYGFSINQTREGGYIILGVTRYSRNWDYNDAYLIKLDENGEQQWKKIIKVLNLPYSICQTTDGGYIISAFKRPYGEGNIIPRLVKTDEQGNEQWRKNLAGSTFRSNFMVLQTSDGGYIMAGDSWSEIKDSSEIMLYKIDAKGNEQWKKTFSGNYSDEVNWIIQTREGDYVFAGEVDGDAWLVRVDAQGRKQWDRTFGLEGYDYANSVWQTSDGGFILAGRIDSAKDPDFKGQIRYDNLDAWLIKTDSYGNLEWSKTFGGLREDRASSVLQAADGGYVLLGSTDSNGSEDIWMIRVAGTESDTSRISESNETEQPDINGTPTKTIPGFEFLEISVSITLLIFLHIKLKKTAKK